METQEQIHPEPRLLLASVPWHEGLRRDRNLPPCNPGWVSPLGQLIRATCQPGGSYR